MDELVGFENVDDRNLAYVFHDAGSKKIVVMAHGFRGSKLGPQRLFVDLARKLAEKGISSLRFDQYGCGDSEGDYSEISFMDWVKSIKYFVEKYSMNGCQVVLFGQSMGGAASFVAASEISGINSIAAWAPDLKVDIPETAKSGQIEEHGQVFSGGFWEEASEADILGSYKKISVPVFVLASQKDEVITPTSNSALFDAQQEKDTFLIMDDWNHSKWTHKQGQAAISQTVDFISSQFQA